MDYQQALADGYTPEEVMGELARRGVKMNYQQAIADGHSPDEVLAEMNSRDKTPAAKPMTVADVGRSKKQQDFAREFIKSQTEFGSNRRFLEGVPVIGSPDRTEAYIRKAYGPEETAPTVAEAMAKGLGRLTNDPAGTLYDFAQNTGAGINRMVSLPYRNLRAATKYAQPGDVEAGEELRNLPVNLVKGALAPTGFAGFDAAREAWQQDPTGSVLTMMGVVKAIPSVTTAAKTAASGALDLGTQIYTGAKGGLGEGGISEAATRGRQAIYNKLSPVARENIFTNMYERLTPKKERRIMTPEDRAALVQKGREAFDEIQDQAANGRIEMGNEYSAAGNWEATRQAQRNLWDQEIQPLLDASGQTVNTTRPIGGMMKQQAAEWQGAGKQQWANKAAAEAEWYNQPHTPQEVQARIAALNEELGSSQLNIFKDEPALARLKMRELGELRAALDQHVMNTIPGAPEFQTLKNRYGALRDYETRLGNLILEDLKRSTNPEARGLSRLAAAEGFGGVLMANPKLIVLGATTQALKILRNRAASADVIVGRMMAARKATGFTPREMTPTPPPRTTTFEPTVGAEIPVGPQAGPQGVNTGGIVQPAPPEPTVYDPSTGAQIPARQGRMEVPRDMRQPAPPEPTVYDPSTGRQIPASQGRAEVPRDMRQPAPPEPTVYDPSTGARIPVQQSSAPIERGVQSAQTPVTNYGKATWEKATKPFEKMTLKERKEAVSVLAESYGISKAEAARIVRRHGRTLSNYGL